MSQEFNPDSEMITNAEVLYLYALLVTFKDGFRCIFDISDLVSEHVIHQPFQDNPLFFYDYVIEADGSKISWNIDFAADNIRECSVALEAVMQYIREQSLHRSIMVAQVKSDPFAEEKARNRKKNHRKTSFESDALGQILTKSILKAKVLAPFILMLTYKDGYKCIFDFGAYTSDSSYNQKFQDNPAGFYDFQMDSWGTNVRWDDLEINAEHIRKLAVPMDEVVQWTREESRKNRSATRRIGEQEKQVRGKAPAEQSRR